MKFSFFLFILFVVKGASCQNFNVVENKIYDSESNSIAKAAVLNVKSFYSEKFKPRSKLSRCQPYQNATFDDELVELMKHGIIKSIKILYLSGNNLEANIYFDGNNVDIALTVELKNNQCNTFIIQEAKLYVDPV